MTTSSDESTTRGRQSRPAKAGLLALAFAVMAAVGVLASACGGSSGEGVAQVDSTETTTTQSDSQSSSGSGDPAAFAACMRRNGVPTFPDLRAQGTPRFDAAKTACASFVPRDDDAPDPSAQAEQLQLLLRYAACMRRNGLPNLPDPEPDPDGYVKISPDELTALGLDPNSPKYRTAAEACKDLEP